MAPYSGDMEFPTAVLAVNSSGLALSFSAVSLRLWSLFIRRVKMRLSDYMIIVSWLFTLALVISENYCVTYGGVGQKMSDVTPEQLLFSSKQFVPIGVFGSLAVASVKISIIDFLLSIFAAQRRFRIAAYILLGITAGYGLSFGIVSLAGCRPFAANWDKESYPDYYCINTSRFYIAQAAIGTTLDCLILLLPVPIVWNLALKTSKKIALTFLFTIGILICAISITRVAYNTQEAWMFAHFTEYAGVTAILGALEANLSIVCACLPTFPPLLAFLSEKIKSTLGSEHSRFKMLLNNSPFGYYRRTAPGTVKLSSSTDKRGNSSTNGDPESSRLPIQHKELVPLDIAAPTTRMSLSGDIGWVERKGGSHTEVDTATSWTMAEALEMARFGDTVEPYNSISVTKTWGVNQS
ncbi:hypothetical protein F4779DRAFT_624743 [Xylariaceae sp. FL0662B]|nr:hypothetical protein F4779DRAFT_624743 [Xylariaceae sp. FL0662B]